MKTTLLSLAVIATLTLSADDTNTTNAITLEALTVSSTAIKTDELRSTDALEIYTAEDIDKAHVQNVYEFLNQQTSLITMPSYGNPFTQLIDLHGYGTSNGAQNIVITLNGRKINNIDLVPQLLSSISPSSISRIEIIKSSGIVVGGDGANAGVINIITKENNDKEITLYGGTYGTMDGSFYIGHSDDKLSISASGEAQKNNGIRYIDSNGNKDKNKLATGTFNLTYTPVDVLELRLGASFSDLDVQYAGYLTKDQYDNDPTQEGAFSSHQKFNTNAISAGTSYYFTDTLSLNIDASHENKKSDYIPSFSGASRYNYNTFKTSLDYKGEAASLSLGMDGFYGDRDTSTDKTTKDNLAGFIMSEFYLGSSTFKAGYRYETVTYKYDSIANNLKDNLTLHGAELGYNYTFTQEQSIFVNYAHSFQAPVIDMFFATTYPPPFFAPVVDFNGFIDPMKADNYTLGYNYILPSNKFKISAYYIDLKDEIYLHKSTLNPFGINTNIDKSHKYGLDLYDKWIITNTWNVVLNYNYVQAIIDEEKDLTTGDDFSGNKLPGVSDHTIKASVAYLPIPEATIMLTEVYRSEAYAADDFNNNFSQKQEAYMSTDLSVSYAKDNYEIFAKINNLFNQKNALWIQDDAIYPINFTTTAIAGFTLKY